MRNQVLNFLLAFIGPSVLATLLVVVLSATQGASELIRFTGEFFLIMVCLDLVSMLVAMISVASLPVIGFGGVLVWPFIGGCIAGAIAQNMLTALGVTLSPGWQIGLPAALGIFLVVVDLVRAVIGLWGKITGRS